MEKEAIDEFNATAAEELPPAETRRNLITHGVRPPDLVGRRFVIGEVALMGLRPCPPCSHLARLLKRPDVLKGLGHSGGIYAAITAGGVL